MSDPKTPEERLEEVKRDTFALVGAWAGMSVSIGGLQRSIDHLAAVARLVGRIEQVRTDIEHCVCRDGEAPPAMERDRDRLLSALDGLEKGGPQS